MESYSHVGYTCFVHIEISQINAVVEQKQKFTRSYLEPSFLEIFENGQNRRNLHFIAVLHVTIGQKMRELRKRFKKLPLCP